MGRAFRNRSWIRLDADLRLYRSFPRTLDWRFSYRSILILCTIFAGIFCILQSFAKNTSQLLWFGVAFGLAVGGVIPTVNAIINLRTLRKDVGKIFGISGSISGAGFALGPIIGGVVASLFTVQTPFIFSGVLLLLAGISVASMKFLRPNIS
ncbi:MAG: MFS transporter [Candidatus Omnitrophica bacterium]|nr:MFS transporter [Candidatus Omnitrophota bacterium]